MYRYLLRLKLLKLKSLGTVLRWTWGAATRDAVEFRIAYLIKMKEILAANISSQDFVDAMKKAYPGLPREARLEDFGKVLYK